MTVTVVLWDIDGTLVRAGRIAGEVFAAVVADVTGVDATAHGVSMGGKTDPQIAREILAALSVDHDESHVTAVLAGIEAGLAAGRAAMRTDGLVLPGVEAVLDRLGRTPDVVQTVLTGNTRANAICKLEAFGLDRYVDIDIGAYGSDDADRNRLVPVALSRVAAARGPVDVARAWVVGDTPFDAACARAGGVRCLLVATGHAPRADLDSAGADIVLDDLSDTDAVVTTLLG